MIGNLWARLKIGIKSESKPLKLDDLSLGGRGASSGPAGGGGEGCAARRLPAHLEQRVHEHQEGGDPQGQLFVCFSMI